MNKEEMIAAYIKIRKKDDILLKKLAIANGNISKSSMIRVALTDYIKRNKHMIEEDKKLPAENEGEN